jgi:hypothetical protein
MPAQHVQGDYYIDPSIIYIDRLRASSEVLFLPCRIAYQLLASFDDFVSGQGDGAHTDPRRRRRG